MTVLRTFGIFVVAALGELAGTYAIWRWLRAGASPAIAVLGAASLFTYAVVQALQQEPRYGRLYAAYAGIFLIGAVLWGWAVEGRSPDRFDGLGAVLVLAGVVTILWGRRLFA